MANRGYAGYDDIDPAVLSDNNFSNGYQTEEESTTSNTQRYPQQTYAQQDYHNSLQRGLAAFPTGPMPYTGSYEELAAQGRGPAPYPTQPAQTLPQVSNEQFSTSFEDLIQGDAPPLTLSEFRTREPVGAWHDTYVGWYIRPPMINLPGIGDVVPIASPFDDPTFGNFPPSNLATPTGPPASRPDPPRRRRNPLTPIREATITPFANPADIPEAAIQAFGEEDREDPGPVHKESVIKACTCYASRKGKIPRASNAWILYRSANSRRGEEYLRKTRNPGGTGASEISKITGKWWREMSEADKAPWQKKAEEEKKEHERLYPEYQYDPGAKYKQEFGTVDCKCGAYEYNMEQRRLRQEREAKNPSKNGKKRGRGKKQQPVPSMDEDGDGVVDEHYGDDSDAFVPSGEKARGKRPEKKRKTNTITSSAAPSTSASAGPSRTTSRAMDQYFEEDFQTPTQQTFQEVVNAGRASRQQTPPRSRATPPRELRTQPNLSYAEPADEGFEDTEMSGTDDNREFGFDDLLQIPDNWDVDSFDMDPTYKAPAPRLSGFGRRSRRADASRSFCARRAS